MLSTLKRKTCFVKYFAGLDEQGLYRIVGVASKVTKLTNLGLGRLPRKTI